MAIPIFLESRLLEGSKSLMDFFPESSSSKTSSSKTSSSEIKTDTDILSYWDAMIRGSPRRFIPKHKLYRRSSPSFKIRYRYQALQMICNMTLPSSRPSFVDQTTWADLNLLAQEKTLVQVLRNYTQIDLVFPDIYDVIIHSEINYGSGASHATFNQKSRFRWWTSTKSRNTKVSPFRIQNRSVGSNSEIHNRCLRLKFDSTSPRSLQTIPTPALLGILSQLFQHLRKSDLEYNLSEQINLIATTYCTYGC